MKSAWATLNVTGGGEAAVPRDVKCWPVGARNIALRWSPIKDVVAYTVQYTRPDGLSLPWQPMISSDTVINVKSPLTLYGFQVRAYIHTSPSPTNKTATLVSEMSGTVTCQGQGVPIKLTKVGESILVSWQSFFEQNPGVTQWILQYKTENSSDEHNITLDGHFYNHTLNLGPEMRSLQVRVLGSRAVPWLRQDLSLVPWTSTSSAGVDLGPGDYLRVRVVPEDVEVTEINPRNFTVRWHCEEEGLPKTYSYMVCTRKVGGDDDCFESSVKWARILHVEPDSSYEVRVQAQLAALAGAFSAPIHVTTPKEETNDLQYTYTRGGVTVTWKGRGPRVVRYSQNLTQPVDSWPSINVTHTSVQITDLDPGRRTFVMVVAPGPNPRSQVLTIMPRPPEASNIYQAV